MKDLRCVVGWHQRSAAIEKWPNGVGHLLQVDRPLTSEDVERIKADFIANHDGGAILLRSDAVRVILASCQRCGAEIR